MAKAKKNEASDAGATKKQATGTKKAAAAAADDGEGTAKPKATTKAASTTKSSASTTKSAGEAGASTGGPTKKKAAAKPAAAQSPGSVPLIDTSLAAQAAAQFVMNRALTGGAATGGSQASSDGQAESQGGEKRESSAFKQLKAGLNKPASQGLGGVLGNADPNRKGNTGFGGGNRQVGRNQTFGADVNRSGVPRRTGG